MAWNEPGGGKDPWSQGPRRGNGSGSGPPDLDELFKRWRSRFKRGGGGGGGGFAGLPTGNIGLIVIAAVLLWLASGFYAVDEQERAVVLRFGAYVETTNPGLRWRLPWPIESVELVNVTQVRQVTERNDMLTQDENIVDVEVKVQYRVSSAERYLFSLQDPDTTLRQVTKSAVREVVGRSLMDNVMKGEGRIDTAERTKDIMQELLDTYESGLVVAEVNFQNIQPPEPVQGAFADAIKAREDQVRLKNEAEAYANDRVPKARGAAARELAEANAYRDRSVAEAQGESERFNKLLTEYRKAPKVTRDRLYLEAISDVLRNANKIVVDVDGNGPMLYLPIDQLNRAQPVELPSSSGLSPSPSRSRSSSPRDEYRSRDRGTR